MAKVNETQNDVFKANIHLFFSKLERFNPQPISSFCSEPCKQMKVDVKLKGATKFPVDLVDYATLSWINIQFAERFDFKFKRLVVQYTLILHLTISLGTLRERLVII